MTRDTEALRVVDPEGTGDQSLPDWMARWLQESVDRVTVVTETDEALARVLRGNRG